MKQWCKRLFNEKFYVAPKGQWNCSVSYWPDFRAHFTQNCNMIPNCLHGEDERDCPYNKVSCSPGEFSAGSTRPRCFRLISPNKSISWLEAKQLCKQAGAYTLASLYTTEEWYDIARRLELFSVKNAYYGLHESGRLPRW